MNDIRHDKKNIKEKILDAARLLFNEHGYNGVSLRDIAQTLEISVGNLTYHYKSKESLVEAVVMTEHSGYCKPPPPETLAELNECFKRVLSHQSRNPYYFHHYKQLAQISPKIHRIQTTVLHDLHDTLKNALVNVRDKALLKADEIPAQSDYLVQTIVSLCAYGTVLENTELLPCIWSLIHPMLTPRGKKLFLTQITPTLPGNQNAMRYGYQT